MIWARAQQQRSGECTETSTKCSTDLKDQHDEKNNSLIPFGSPLFSDGGAIAK
jgi:hypothetical protein